MPCKSLQGLLLVRTEGSTHLPAGLGDWAIVVVLVPVVLLDLLLDFCQPSGSWGTCTAARRWIESLWYLPLTA